MKTKPILKTFRENDLLDEILGNLVKYNFKYTLAENSIMLYSEEKEALTYIYPGLLIKLRDYIMRKLGCRIVESDYPF